jgi:hypothetical protein
MDNVTQTKVGLLLAALFVVAVIAAGLASGYRPGVVSADVFAAPSANAGAKSTKTGASSGW